MGVEVTLGPLVGGGRLTFDGSLDLESAARLSESVDEMSSTSFIPPPTMAEGGMTG